MGKKAKTQKTDRRHLTPREVESLIQGVAESSRNSERDRCLLLLTYRHGFRVSEVCGLPLDHVDIDGRVLHVKPPKALKTLFISEQRRPLHRSTVNLLVKTASRAASLPFVAHLHMLRHACGYALADQGAA